MKYKIGIIGHFGFGKELVNGQTIKTKIVSNVIAETFNNNVSYVDAHGGIKAILPVFFGCIKLLTNCDNIMIFLTENGLKVAVPTLSFFNIFFQKRLHYNVIGGWLPNFLIENKYLISYLKKFDNIFTETNTMKVALERLGLTNCTTIPNCKKLSIVAEDSIKYEEVQPLKICTFSRVMKEKGIEDLINVVYRINQKAGRLVYTLDIYGQVETGQTVWFEDLSSKFPEYIKYFGVIPFEKSVEVLKNYFALVFPTRFYTEGVPGTIVDAYAAGLPVISARWESFEDVIDEKVTGYGFEFLNLEDLTKLLEEVAKKPTMITNLKKNCIKKASDYSLDRLKDTLIKYIK